MSHEFPFNYALELRLLLRSVLKMSEHHVGRLCVTFESPMPSPPPHAFPIQSETVIHADRSRSTFLSTVAHCFQSKNYVNLMVGSKQPSAVFLSADEAESHCRAGGSIFKFASTEAGLNPDVVLVGIGAELTFEVIAAAALLHSKIPELRVRVVNVTDLMILGCASSHPHSLTDEAFAALFTADRPVHFNYHGYSQELKGLLFGRPGMSRVSIASYMEEGSTTTPFNMMLLNETSRFHVAIKAVQGAARGNEKVALRLHELVSELEHEIKEVQKFIVDKKTGMF